MKYILVGGNPLRSYTGTTTFTGLRVVGSSDDKEEIIEMYGTNYDDCGGLLLVIDTETGDAAENLVSKKSTDKYRNRKFKELNLSAEVADWVTLQYQSYPDSVNSDYKIACGQSWESVADDLAEIMGLDEAERVDMTDLEFRKVWDAFFCE